MMNSGPEHFLLPEEAKDEVHIHLPPLPAFGTALLSAPGTSSYTLTQKTTMDSGALRSFHARQPKSLLYLLFGALVQMS